MTESSKMYTNTWNLSSTISKVLLNSNKPLLPKYNRSPIKEPASNSLLTAVRIKEIR